MDESQVAATVMKFMERCQVQGSEVMHFMACMQWLESKARPPQQPASDPDQAEPTSPSKRARKG